MIPLQVLDFLSAEEQALLLPRLGERLLPSGEQFCREGERNGLVAFVLSGRLAVRKPTEFPGRWQTIALLSAGAVAGEGGVLEEGLHGATVVALEDTRVLLLTREVFSSLTETAPALAIKILRHLLGIASQRLQHTSHRLSLVL